MTYNPFISILNSLLPEPQASLLNGILFGVRAAMSKSLYQALIDTGALHIIALSGMNITILSALIARITMVFGRKTSSLVSIVGITAFILFVGASPSVVRAGIMGSVSFIAIYFGRNYWALLGLFAASGMMLVFDMSLSSNLSFQLSFLATLGIILVQKIDFWKSVGKKSILYPLKEDLKLTLAAQVCTAPVILYNFHRLSLIGPVANVAIGWVIQPIMVLGFITAIVGWVFLPLGFVLAWITWVPLTYVISVVEFLARIPFASVQF